MIFRYIGLMIGIVVYAIAEIYCTLKIADNEMFPRSEVLKEILGNYILLFFLFIFAMIFMQWSAVKLTNGFYDDNYSLLEKVYSLVFYFGFTIIIPWLMMLRFLYYIWEKNYMFIVSISLIYLLASFLTVIKKKWLWE